MISSYSQFPSFPEKEIIRAIGFANNDYYNKGSDIFYLNARC